jgi:hypothetical protein
MRLLDELRAENEHSKFREESQNVSHLDALPEHDQERLAPAEVKNRE